MGVTRLGLYANTTAGVFAPAENIVALQPVQSGMRAEVRRRVLANRFAGNLRACFAEPRAAGPIGNACQERLLGAAAKNSHAMIVLAGTILRQVTGPLQTLGDASPHGRYPKLGPSPLVQTLDPQAALHR